MGACCSRPAGEHVSLQVHTDTAQEHSASETLCKPISAPAAQLTAVQPADKEATLPKVPDAEVAPPTCDPADLQIVEVSGPDGNVHPPLQSLEGAPATFRSQIDPVRALAEHEKHQHAGAGERAWLDTRDAQAGQQGRAHNLLKCGVPRAPNETERAQVMAWMHLMDDPPCPELDNLLAVVQHVFDAPHAAITLFEDGQVWLSNSAGGPPHRPGYQLATCPWIFLAPRPMILLISDLHKDARFAETVWAVERGVRCYASSPMVSTTSHRLGTICFLDGKARLFDACTARFMNNMAELAVRELEKFLDMPRKLMEALGQPSHLRLRQLTRSLEPVTESCVVLVDTFVPGMKILYATNTWQAWTGATRETVIGKTLAEVLDVAGCGCSLSVTCPVSVTGPVLPAKTPATAGSSDTSALSGSVLGVLQQPRAQGQASGLVSGTHSAVAPVGSARSSFDQQQASMWASLARDAAAGRRFIMSGLRVQAQWAAPELQAAWANASAAPQSGPVLGPADTSGFLGSATGTTQATTPPSSVQGDSRASLESHAAHVASLLQPSSAGVFADATANLEAGIAQDHQGVIMHKAHAEPPLSPISHNGSVRRLVKGSGSGAHREMPVFDCSFRPMHIDKLDTDTHEVHLPAWADMRGTPGHAPAPGIDLNSSTERFRRVYAVRLHRSHHNMTSAQSVRLSPHSHWASGTHSNMALAMATRSTQPGRVAQTTGRPSITHQLLPHLRMGPEGSQVTTGNLEAELLGSGAASVQHAGGHAVSGTHTDGSQAGELQPADLFAAGVSQAGVPLPTHGRVVSVQANFEQSAAEVFAGIHVQHTIGRGSYGVVMVATWHDTQVAVKVQDHVFKSLRQRKAAELEVAIGLQLAHPHVLRTLAVASALLMDPSAAAAGSQAGAKTNRSSFSSTAAAASVRGVPGKQKSRLGAVSSQTDSLLHTVQEADVHLSLAAQIEAVQAAANACIPGTQLLSDLLSMGSKAADATHASGGGGEEEVWRAMLLGVHTSNGVQTDPGAFSAWSMGQQGMLNGTSMSSHSDSDEEQAEGAGDTASESSSNGQQGRPSMAGSSVHDPAELVFPQRVRTWLQMEFADGGTLQEAIDRGWYRCRLQQTAGPDMLAVLRASLGLARGLEHLHLHGIVHGDLSGYNVLLSSEASAAGGHPEDWHTAQAQLDPQGLHDGSACLPGLGCAPSKFLLKICDFGKAYRLPSAEDTIKSGDYGTITHMAPEVLKGQVGAAADIYSAGVLMWSMYTGARPWAGMTHAHIFAQVLDRGELKWPDTVLGTLMTDKTNGAVVNDTWFKVLARQCMAYEHTQRPTAAALVQELEALSARVDPAWAA